MTDDQLRKLFRIIPFLQCPRNGDGLRFAGDSIVSDSGEVYPIVDGKPILVKTICPIHVTEPATDIVSQNIGEYTPPSGLIDGPKVHLGSGNVPCKHPEVISVDILPNEHVDIVAEAENLPFKTESVSYVESGAVFEHLYDPIRAAQEVRRVLIPGGQMYIDTAFMQGYHGFPCHYFNMTPQAVETFIVDDFELISSSVPVDAGPANSVEALLRKFIEALPLEERMRLLSMKTQELLESLGKPEEWRRLHGLTSEHVRRSLGASSCVVARKPINPALDEPSYKYIRRGYYTARAAVIQRHHELEFYKERTQEECGHMNGPAIPSLHQILTSAAPRNIESISAWSDAITNLERIDAELTRLRDEWIRCYLTNVPASKQSFN